MSRINRVQDIGTQDVTFDDSDFGFSVTNTSVPSAHNAAAAAQHQEAASANRERARLNSLRAEEATQKHMQRAHENAQTSRSNTSRASRGAGFHDPHVAPTGDWAVYAPTSHAREAASTTATANTQKQVVINQVMGEQTIGFVNNYHSSTAAPPTDCNSTTGVNTEVPEVKADQTSMGGSQAPTDGDVSKKESKANGPPSWYESSSP